MHMIPCFERGQAGDNMYKLRVFGVHIKKGGNCVEGVSLDKTKNIYQACNVEVYSPLSRLATLKGPFCPSKHLVLLTFAMKLCQELTWQKRALRKTSILSPTERRLLPHGTTILRRYALILQMRGHVK